MSTSSLVEVETGHSLGLAYLSDIPAGADTIAAGANITITTVGTVNTIAATVPIQTITNSKNISVAYNAGTFTETITGVVYPISASDTWTSASTSIPTESTPVAIAIPAATPFSANPTASVGGTLQCDVDLTFGALITTSGGVPDNGIALTIILYTGTGQPLVPPSGDAVYIGETTLMLTGPFVATANPNEYKVVSFTSVPIYCNTTGATVSPNPAIGCGASWFVRGTQNITSVVLTQPTVQVIGHTSSL
jgi:hypothetical protein